MISGIQIARDVVARAYSVDGIRLVDYVIDGESFCQQFAGNFWEQVKGVATPQSYRSAKLAMDASGPLNPDWNAAPAGAYHYYDYLTFGHVAPALGSGLQVSGTGYSTGALESMGKHVYVHRVADYAKHLNYRGWAMTNGARPTLIGLVSDANAPTILPTQRQVKPNADANIRLTPTTDATRVVLKAGSIITPEGVISSTLHNGQPNGSDKWAKVAEGYLSMTVFTDPGLHDLPDFGVIPAPKPKHIVTINFGPDNVKTVEIVDGELVTQPGDPERDEFLFNGWAVDGVLYDFATPVTSAFTIEALWSAKPMPVDPPPAPGEPADAPAWWTSFWRAVIEFLTSLFKPKE